MSKLRLIVILALLLSACKPNLEISHAQGAIISNDNSSTELDSSLVQFIRPYSEQLAKEMGGTVIMAATTMVRNKPESELTNCLTDILLENGRQIGAKLKGSPYPDVAYINYYSLRSTFSQGAISLGKLYEMFPFENQIVFVQMSGASLWKFAEVTAQRGGDGVAGIQLVITKDGDVSSFQINGNPVDKNKYYWVVTSDYVANGGDNMRMFLNPKQRIDSGFKIRDSFIDYMRAEHKAGRSLSGKLDGRISYE